MARSRTSWGEAILIAFLLMLCLLFIGVVGLLIVAITLFIMAFWYIQIALIIFLVLVVIIKLIG